MNSVVKVLGTLAAVMLLYNMAAIPVLREQVFLKQGAITSGGELLILVGFVLVAVFNLTSLAWLWPRGKRAQTLGKANKAVLALGFLCLVLLMGDKVMVDEIAREYALGWPTAGEWLILYIFLAVQMGYTLLVLWRLRRPPLGKALPA